MQRSSRFSSFILLVLTSVLLLCGCGAAQNGQNQQNEQKQEPQTAVRDSDVRLEQLPTPTPPGMTLQQQVANPTPGAATVPDTTADSPQNTPQNAPTDVPNSGTGAAPYGSPPTMTNKEMTLSQQLFALINADRATRGLYAFAWNPTLSGGARLHSWNMYHCGFSHTCPDGLSQCQRIENEGFTGVECAEAIGYAGPYPTPYQGMHNIQESMVNEPPTGWHRIHLLSSTLHKVGVGLYVDPGGFIWFTEDFVA